KKAQNDVRLSAGIVFAFGGAPAMAPVAANQVPTVTCSADKTMVYTGSDESVGFSAVANDPDRDPLGYTWTTTGGAVQGAGPDVAWSDAGLAPGTYTVHVAVNDG